MKEVLLILGSKSTAIELMEYIQALEKFDEIQIVFISEELNKEEVINRWIKEECRIFYIFGVIDIIWRNIYRNQIDNVNQFEPFTFIHPSAFVANSVSIGCGVYIAPNASIAPHAEIHDHAHISLNASVGHHAIIGSDTTVLPGVRISGNVEVGERCLIGSNSVLFQGVKIGNESVVDALCYIKKDVAKRSISYASKTKTIQRVI